MTPGHCIWTESEVSVSHPRPSEEDGSIRTDGPPDPLVSSPVTSQDEAIIAIRAPQEWEKKLYCFGGRDGVPEGISGKSHRTPSLYLAPSACCHEEWQPRTVRSSVFRRSQKRGLNFPTFNILFRPNKTFCWDRPDPWTTSSLTALEFQMSDSILIKTPEKIKVMFPFSSVFGPWK